jgi:hypothetical protein
MSRVIKIRVCPKCQCIIRVLFGQDTCGCSQH